MPRAVRNLFCPRRGGVCKSRRLDGTDHIGYVVDSRLVWRIEEHRQLDKQLGAVPREILKRYEKWKDIAMISGRLDSGSPADSTMRLCMGRGGDIVPHGWACTIG
jgi:hypothetical protein